MKHRTNLRNKTSWIIASGLSFGLLGTVALAQTTAPEKERTEEASLELVLEQLQELRNELRALRSEMGELKKEVSDIHRVAVRPPEPPAPTTAELGDKAIMGNPEATVAIIEFSDYQCPYCKRFQRQTFPRIKKNYIDTGKVRYVFRDFPLQQIHSEASSAAVAANCSGQQGKFWEMHGALFNAQGRLGLNLYKAKAEELGLNLEDFESCLADPVQAEKVNEELLYGQSLGIRGTPHFLLGRIEGGRIVDVTRISGARPFQAFATAIDSLLK
jgi:protein-disulfide isomerase